MHNLRKLLWNAEGDCYDANNLLYGRHFIAPISDDQTHKGPLQAAYWSDSNINKEAKFVRYPWYISWFPLSWDHRDLTPHWGQLHLKRYNVNSPTIPVGLHISCIYARYSIFWPVPIGGIILPGAKGEWREAISILPTNLLFLLDYFRPSFITDKVKTLWQLASSLLLSLDLGQDHFTHFFKIMRIL